MVCGLPAITAIPERERPRREPRPPRIGSSDMENLHDRSPASNSRRRLPQRRSAIAVELEHAGHRFRMQIGRFPDGVQGEVYLDAAKQNSALDALAADAAILISLLLQHGA